MKEVEPDNSNVQDILFDIRDQLAERGIKGTMELARKFKVLHILI